MDTSRRRIISSHKHVIDVAFLLSSLSGRTLPAYSLTVVLAIPSSASIYVQAGLDAPPGQLKWTIHSTAQTPYVSTDHRTLKHILNIMVAKAACIEHRGSVIDLSMNRVATGFPTSFDYRPD
jgi:hypothetical protein